MTRRVALAALGCTTAMLTCAPALVSIKPAFIWNATASTPVGFYAVHAANDLHDGELVVAMPPDHIASFLARGGFLPRGVPLLKHVAALAGQIVCRTGDTITIDGKAAGVALDRDHLGRPLPRWSGCHRLRNGEVFLMNISVRDSLDGRYFGPLPVTAIVGQAAPLWIERHQGGAAPASADGAPVISPPAERQSP